MQKEKIKNYDRVMDLLSLLFPRRCVGCKEIGSYLCPDCVNSFRPMFQLYCPACRKPSATGVTHPLCRHIGSLDGLVSCFSYTGNIKKIVSKFKYAFVQDFADTLTELMTSSTTHQIFFNHSWNLVPIPLHPSRLKWRGFNQAEVLAQGLGNNFGWEVNTQMLIRNVDTVPQMNLSGKQRRQNLQNTFQIVSKKIPSRILLVDDVATTCTTLNECAAVLKQAGANEVWGLTLAQAIPR